MTGAVRQMRIDDLMVNYGEARAARWIAQPTHDLRSPDTGRHIDREELAVMVVLDVDGTYDLVYGDNLRDDIGTLDRVIEAVQRIRDALTAAYGDAPRATQCMAAGGWGRCRYEAAHDGPHRFPDPPKGYPGYEDPLELERVRTIPWEGSPA